MNGCSSAPALVKEYEIPQVLSSLFNEIDRYENLCVRITERIGSIVSPCPPQDSKNGLIEKGFNTNLATEIHHQKMKMRRVSDDLESLLSRIEL